MTETKSPGHNSRSRLSNVALSLIVPVIVSTALSMNVSRPSLDDEDTLRAVSSSAVSPEAAVSNRGATDADAVFA
jgi:hypothetical protein